MTRDGAVNLILARLRRAGNTALASDIISEMNLWQTTEAEAGAFGQMWFLLRYRELEVSVDGLQATLPDDFLSFPQNDGGVFLPAAVDGDPTALVGSSRLGASGTLLGQFDTSSGAGWSQQGSTINFAAALAAGDVPIAIYYGGEPLNELAYGAGSQPDPNAWLVNAPDWVIAEMCYLFANNYLKYSDADERFAPAITKAKARLVTQNTLQEEGALQRVLNSYYVRSASARGGATVLPA